MKIGSRVRFVDKMFAPPYSPYYDEYNDQVFEVLLFHVIDENTDDLIECHYHEPNCHVELMCVSNPDIKVAGLVHDDEIEVI